MLIFAPKLYTVRSFTLRELIDSDFNLSPSLEEEVAHQIRQQDNQLFRLIRIVTKTESKFNPFVIFVDCSGVSNYDEAIRHIVYEGVTLHGNKYVMSERSGSMKRVGTISLIDARISEEMAERVTVGIDVGETVQSKCDAFRGLMF